MDTILITGGSAGIGRALARRYHARGDQVLVCGRDEARLADAARAMPGLATFVADVSRPEDRALLAQWATREHPALNTVIHNAGVMRFPNFADAPDFGAIQGEIATNLEAPMHLAILLVPHLTGKPGARLVFVSSGLAFVPLVAAPVYSATKAGVHAFAMALRSGLAPVGIEVLEIIPPHVDTDLGTGDNATGMPLEEFADAAFAGLGRGDREIAVGFSAKGSGASRAELDAMFASLNVPR